MYNITKQNLKDLLSEIETLAKNTKDSIDNGADHLAMANELVRNATTLIFALGEVYASEQLNKPKSNKVYFRDSKGRFARKV